MLMHLDGHSLNAHLGAITANSEQAQLLAQALFVLMSRAAIVAKAKTGAANYRRCSVSMSAQPK